MFRELRERFGKIDYGDYGQVKKVAEFLKERDDLCTARDEYDRTALIVAAENDCTTIVLALLGNKELLDLKDCDGNTALMVALKNGAEASAYMLLTAGADKTVVNLDGESTESLFHKYLRFVPYRDAWEGNPVVTMDHVDTRSFFGHPGELDGKAEKRSFLYYLYERAIDEFFFSPRADLSKVDSLIATSLCEEAECILVDIMNRKNISFNTVIEGKTLKDIFLSHSTSTELLNALSECGVKLDEDKGGTNKAHVICKIKQYSPENVLSSFKELDPALFSAYDEFGLTPLHYAAKKNNVELVKVMVENGADTGLEVLEDSDDFKKGQTALIIAMEEDDWETMPYLVDSPWNTEYRDEHGNTMAHKIVSMTLWNDTMKNNFGKDKDIFHLLLDKVKDIDVPNDDGITPLMIPRPDEEKRADTVSYLVSRGANVNAKDRNGDPVMCHYLKRESTDALRVLLDAGADPNARNRQGDTPFMLAAKEYCYMPAARMIMDYGADGALENRKGNTALNIMKDVCFEWNPSDDMLCAYNRIVARITDPYLKVAEKKYGERIIFSDRRSVNRFADFLIADKDLLNLEVENGHNAILMAVNVESVTLTYRLLKAKPEFLDAKDGKGRNIMNIARENLFDDVEKLLCAFGMKGAEEYSDDFVKNFTTVRYEPRIRDCFNEISKNGRKTHRELKSGDWDTLTLALACFEHMVKTEDVDEEFTVGFLACVLDQLDSMGLFAESMEVFCDCGFSLETEIAAQKRFSTGRNSVDCSVHTFQDLFLNEIDPVKVLSMLKKNGVDINGENSRGYSYCGIVFRRDPESFRPYFNSEMRDKESEYAYYSELVSFFSLDALEQLDQDGLNCLHYAALKDNDSLIKVLIDYGMDINRQDDSSFKESSPGHAYYQFETALIKACRCRNEKAAVMLLQCGADQTITDRDGWTALQRLADCSGSRSMERIGKFFSSPDIQNDKGQTALMLCQKDDTDATHTEILINLGADVNISDNEGNTALFYCVECLDRRDTEGLKLLLGVEGIDVNHLNSEGESALIRLLKQTSQSDGTRNQKLRDRALMLIDAGADINAEDNEGNTAMSLLIKLGFSELLDHVKN